MDNETNRIIAEWLGKCWHELVEAPSIRQPSTRRRKHYECSKGCGLRCKGYDDRINRPDYDKSLDAVREAELKAVEVFGAKMYVKMMALELFSVDQSVLITAPASIRAAAVRRLLEAK